MIKVMNVKDKGGKAPKVRENQRPKDVPVLLIVLRSLRFRTKQVIKVMRAKDKGDKKTDSDKCFYWIR